MKSSDTGKSKLLLFLLLSAMVSPLTVLAGDGNTWSCTPPRYESVTPATYNLQSWPSGELRGVNLSPDYNSQSGVPLTRADIQYLSQNWGANHARVQLFGLGVPSDYGGPSGNQTLTQYLVHLDEMLGWLAEFNFTVVLDCHVAPGDVYINDRTQRIWTESAMQTHLINLWTALAQKYKNDTTIIAYELLNEPQMDNQAAGDLSDWNFTANGLAKRVTDAIRAIDTYHTIIVGGVYWSSPYAVNCMVPTGDDNTIYTIHMYQPFNFTYQGLYGTATGVSFPGVIDGTWTDKSTLSGIFGDTVNFQAYHSLPLIYVGEFSVVNWAPGTSGHDYLRALVEIFHSNGWSWGYHSYREEWRGFSLEHVCEDTAAATCAEGETDRLRLIKAYLGGYSIPSLDRFGAAILVLAMLIFSARLITGDGRERKR